MTKPWSTVRLGEVLRQRRPDVSVEQTESYQFAGVYCFGRGVFRGQERSGSEFAYPTLSRLRAGEFVYPKLMAWEGAFGVVPASCNGCYVSPEFPVFEIDGKRLDSRFLSFYFQIPRVWESVSGGSTGTNIRRRRLNPTDFIQREIPLPPLAEQRRVVARIEALAAQVHEARTLKKETKEETDYFWKVYSRMARATKYPVRRLDEMAEFLDGRRVPLSKEQRATRKGQFPYYGASGVIDHIDDFIFDEPLLLLSEDGANLINRSTPIAFVANGKYWVNNHAHVLKPFPCVADLHFLAYALSDYDVSVFNFASAQAKLNQKYARTIQFPLPPLPEQRRIVAELDALQAEVDALKRLQAETATELDALLPAVLDKAFKGEL